MDISWHHVSSARTERGLLCLKNHQLCSKASTKGALPLSVVKRVVTQALELQIIAHKTNLSKKHGLLCLVMDENSLGPRRSQMKDDRPPLQISEIYEFKFSKLSCILKKKVRKLFLPCF